MERYHADLDSQELVRKQCLDEFLESVHKVMDNKYIEFSQKAAVIESRIDRESKELAEKVQQWLDVIYAEKLKAVRESSLKEFEDSIDFVFERNADRLVPILLKSLTGKMFRRRGK